MTFPCFVFRASALVLLALSGCGGWSAQTPTEDHEEPPATDACAPEGTDYPRGLHVRGNRIYDAQGTALMLRGVNHSGSEYMCAQSNGVFEGPISRCSVKAMVAWNINAVRIPLNEACWLGLATVTPGFSGENYKSAIQSYVALLHEFGIVPILDLHWAAPGSSPATDLKPMPNVDHSVDFWRDVASAFRDDDGVLLELYNEPFPDTNRDTDAAWQCWRDGCEEFEVPWESKGPYRAVGMQALVDAVREAGSEHVLLLGGVEYSNALTQWLTYKPEDPLGRLGAAWHIYNFNRCSNRTCWNDVPAAVAAEVPVIATEIGQNDCGGNFVTPLMDFLDSRSIGYLAWSWNAHGACESEIRNGPDRRAGNPWSLITSYTAPQPNSDYARAFQQRLLSFAN